MHMFAAGIDRVPVQQDPMTRWRRSLWQCLYRVLQQSVQALVQSRAIYVRWHFIEMNGCSTLDTRGICLLVRLDDVAPGFVSGRIGQDRRAYPSMVRAS